MNELLTILDTKYKRLEYIESTGTQYIDLGLTANQDIIIKCRVSNVNSGTQPFIGLSDANNLIYGIGQQSDGNYLFSQYYKTIINNGRIVSDIVGNDGIVRNFELRKNEFYIDNVLIGSITYHTFTTQNTIKLFTLNPSSSKASIKMYNAQVLDGNMNLLRNMIPVMRKSDNEIGMLDLVEGKFYPNAGTGKFTANLDTMYALIQGTPTVQDGRVSGFSSSDYLKINQTVSLGSSFEIVTKITTGSDVSTQTVFISGKTNQYFNLCVQNGKIQQNIGNGSAWLINVTAQTFGITDIQTNTSYLVKFTFDGSIYKTFISIDNGKTWILDWSYSSSSIIPNCQIVYGVSRSLINAFTGTLDLNRSYIKIDDTKYKLQAVVGYSQPSGSSVTITNGIASGFSSSNYLQINNGFSLEKDFEIETEFSANSVTAGNLITFVGNNGNNYGMYIDTNQKIHFFTPIATSTSTSIAGTTTIPFNTICKAKYVRNKDIQILYLDIGNGYKIEATRNITGLNAQNIVRFDICKGATGINQINLNNTHINLNHKLWFNGLEQ